MPAGRGRLDGSLRGRRSRPGREPAICSRGVLPGPVRAAGRRGPFISKPRITSLRARLTENATAIHKFPTALERPKRRAQKPPKPEFVWAVVS